MLAPMLRLLLTTPLALLVLFALAPAPGRAEVRVDADLDLEEVAECVADSGAVFYGAWWCPQCRRQNEYFGEHAGALPYVECYDGARSQGQNDTCHEAGVRAYPTWILDDGRQLRGAQSPLKLASATGCLGL